MPYRTVLIVDDDPTFIRLVSTLLVRHDYHCLCAPTASVAMRMAVEHEVDVMLIDLHMPGFNGIDAIRAMNDQGHNSVPKILLTADTSTRARQVAHHYSAAAVLNKPVDEEVLISAIEEAINTELRDAA